MKRLFIGIGFKEDVRNYFIDTQLMIEKYCEVAKYTSYNNYHLTLKFLGMMDESTIDSLIEIINSLSIKNFSILFDHIGFFKKKNRYVIYTGLQSSELLMKLAVDLNTALVEAQFLEQELFIYTPHVTLCRNAKLLVPTVDLSRGIQIKKEITVDNIILYESTNHNGVLTYQPLYIREV